MVVKKIIYFLFACDEQQSQKFFSRIHVVPSSGQVFSPLFLEKLSSGLNQVKKKLKQENPSSLSPWQLFCKKNNYEEILAVVLCGIVKQPIKDVAWMIRKKPELISYRFSHGLLALADELLEKTSSNRWEEKDREMKAQEHCNWLARKDLPLCLQKIKERKKKKWWFYLFFAIFVLLGVTIMVFFVFAPKGPIILYPVFLEAVNGFSFV